MLKRKELLTNQGVRAMLVLSRREGENIIIGDGVTIAVLGIYGNQVRIGIKAPEDVSVHR